MSQTLPIYFHDSKLNHWLFWYVTSRFGVVQTAHTIIYLTAYSFKQPKLFPLRLFLYSCFINLPFAFKTWSILLLQYYLQFFFLIQTLLFFLYYWWKFLSDHLLLSFCYLIVNRIVLLFVDFPLKHKKALLIFTGLLPCFTRVSNHANRKFLKLVFSIVYVHVDKLE